MGCRALFLQPPIPKAPPCCQCQMWRQRQGPLAHPAARKETTPASTAASPRVCPRYPLCSVAMTSHRSRTRRRRGSALLRSRHGEGRPPISARACRKTSGRAADIRGAAFLWPPRGKGPRRPCFHAAAKPGPQAGAAPPARLAVANRRAARLPFQAPSLGCRPRHPDVPVLPTGVRVEALDLSMPARALELAAGQAGRQHVGTRRAAVDGASSGEACEVLKFVASVPPGEESSGGAASALLRSRRARATLDEPLSAAGLAKRPQRVVAGSACEEPRADPPQGLDTGEELLAPCVLRVPEAHGLGRLAACEAEQVATTGGPARQVGRGGPPARARPERPGPQQLGAWPAQRALSVSC
jgi:hypothetical protein